MIDQAASQPSLATVSLNLAWSSSRDMFVVIVVRICRATLLDVCLNTRQATAQYLITWLSGKYPLTRAKLRSRDRTRITETISRETEKSRRRAPLGICRTPVSSLTAIPNGSTIENPTFSLVREGY